MLIVIREKPNGPAPRRPVFHCPGDGPAPFRRTTTGSRSSTSFIPLKQQSADPIYILSK